MKAIKLTVSNGERAALSKFVEYVNTNDMTAATMVDRDTAFIATENEYGLRWVMFVATRKFNEYMIETIK
ncbi:MAG: hypothetical protein HDS81_07590 [Bacteroidales bacterium]|nr:hypothetical protein [Bacteroidales bacterium]